MKTEDIIKDLEKRQKALSNQLFDLPEESESTEEEIWTAEVSAKLELVDELLGKYKNKKKKGK